MWLLSLSHARRRVQKFYCKLSRNAGVNYLATSTAIQCSTNGNTVSVAWSVSAALHKYWVWTESRTKRCRCDALRAFEKSFTSVTLQSVMWQQVSCNCNTLAEMWQEHVLNLQRALQPQLCARWDLTIWLLNDLLRKCVSPTSCRCLMFCKLQTGGGRKIAWHNVQVERNVSNNTF